MGLFLQFAAPALAGIFVGVMSGLLGVGGGTIMVPIFRLAFGMSPLASTATSLFAIIPTSISGVASHMRAKTCVPKLGVALGVGGALTSPVGVWLASVSPGWLVIVVAALVVGLSAYKMFKKAIKAPRVALSCRKAHTADAAATCGSASRGEAEDLRTEVRGASAFPTGCTTTGALADASEPASSNPIPAQPDLTRKHYLQGAGIGLVAGLASGYVGVGGGFIMVPMMLAILSIPMSLASGTSLIAIMILAIPGVIEQAILGNINYFAGISIVVGTIPGAVIGARLVRVIPERQLRFAFGGFLLVAAVLLMLNEFGILG
ncbi:sulfite exporter TauE/SafE family protein [Senegalimassilia faecalis]|uniref:Probable membrane transporter protein n=1 Tax=Senegalimassilia faecalis TaxID=2509433 RepID=A0A4Q2K0I6_9ACTN|nr:sulfite exporter TauE/SafE family protein [Senegalimassilia faecalis]RXZ53848.1 sulfite exporter TauE/SafE family protein [Senegalimassilia faecalis]